MSITMNCPAGMCDFVCRLWHCTFHGSTTGLYDLIQPPRTCAFSQTLWDGDISQSHHEIAGFPTSTTRFWNFLEPPQIVRIHKPTRLCDCVCRSSATIYATLCYGNATTHTHTHSQQRSQTRAIHYCSVAVWAYTTQFPMIPSLSGRILYRKYRDPALFL